MPVDDQEHFKDVDLMLFDKVIAFDNLKQKIVLIVNIKLSSDNAKLQAAYEQAQRDLEHLASLLRHGKPLEEPKGKILSPITPLFSSEQYCAMVEKAKHYIFEGDIFQIVLSNRLSAEFSGSLLDTYRILRTLNPSPYMFYFGGTDVEVAGASPENFVKLKKGVVHTFPLAGTPPRGKTEKEDRAF